MSAMMTTKEGQSTVRSYQLLCIYNRRACNALFSQAYSLATTCIACWTELDALANMSDIGKLV